MKKFLIIILACLLLVSCATTKYTANNTEDSHFFYAEKLKNPHLEVPENQELRDLFDKFNDIYFDGALIVDYIGYVDRSLLRNKEDTFNYNGIACWFFDEDECEYTYAIAMPRNLAGKNFFNGVMIHEMTHLYFYQKEMFDEDHGPNFRNKIDELYEINPQFEKVYY
ncbi:MAG: hypothetical protein J5631_15080 [Spirochaetaceae bacterium]|nr:hypothetical protein [Spirochaetaceae bacterium]